MMDMNHSEWVLMAKSLGLFYLMGLSAAVVLYACWPSNRDKFDRAASAIIEDEDEDKPCL